MRNRIFLLSYSLLYYLPQLPPWLRDAKKSKPSSGTLSAGSITSYMCTYRETPAAKRKT